MPTTTIAIPTSAGECSTQICTPDGAGPWPVVVVCYDAFGPRQSITDIANRIAKSGYLVAIPDLFHRSGAPSDLLPPDAKGDPHALFKIFGDDALRQKFMSTFYLPALDYENLKVTIGAVLDTLAKRKDVTGKIGTTGYCMGGNASFRIATLFGDRIKATASFHGGFLVAPGPDSPSARAASIQSQVYVAGAIEDDSFTDEAKHALIQALDAAHVKNTVETYPAKHGFAVADNPSFDAAAAERHFKALESFFASTLH